MTFYEVLEQVVTLLQRHGRMSYRALTRQFQLDEVYLEDLKAELVDIQRVAVDQEGTMLVWTGDAPAAPPLVTSVPALERTPRAYTPAHLTEKILAARTALEGERKQVTVLFADIKGSMELLAERDPEEARQLLDPVLEHMMAAVHRYEGTVNQVMGDGIMALFGAPIAHEDHAVRACYAALAMQAAVKQYAAEVQRSHGVPVQIRVGLNAGEVVVRAIGSDLHMDYTAVGQTTHLAARMEQMAMPGSILLTQAALSLAEGYVQVTPLGPVPVKGLAAPVDVFELVGASGIRRRLQATAARGLTRFVGRDTELAALVQALERAGAGHGQVVAVVGEAGVGKSRLVYECVHSHHTQAWRVLESASVSYGKATPYFPVLDMLRRYAHLDEQDDPRTLRAKVTGQLLTLDEALQDAIPPLLALLDALPDDSPFLTLDPPQRRQRTLTALKRVLLRESQVQPVLVVFEDLHWIDTETQALLDSLVESLPTARLLLLVNYRPEYQHGWWSKTYYAQLRLDPLPPASADAFLQAWLGDGPGLAALKPLLIARTAGNPFFLEESVRTLVESGVLVGERGAYRLAQALARMQVPATVQAVLAARIDRLPPEEKHLLQTAAVIGYEVPLPLLDAIADVPEAALYRGLAHLQAAEFLYETRLFPEREFLFKHALTHEVAYGGLLQERRRVLHARIVEALEALAAERLTEHVDRLAHHAVRGEVWDKALTYSRQAGAKAMARSAHREAVACFEQALAALAQLPERRNTLEQAIDLRCDLRNALLTLGEQTRIFDYLREAEVLAERLGDDQRLGRVAGYLCIYFSNMGEHDRAIAAGQRALALATTSGAFDDQVVAQTTLGIAYNDVGDFRQALDFFQRVRALLTGEQRYAEEVRRTQGLLVQMRVGLNSGEVVVRAIGNDLHMDYSAVGQTTHLAARMEQLAAPGSILLTTATLRLVEVFELVGVTALRRRLQTAVARGLSPFVGRQHELAALQQALGRAEAGQGQVVALLGEPGVGKSRLVYEFLQAHHTQGWLRLESSSVSYGKATAYLPVCDLLKAYCHIEDRDDLRTVRAKITGQILTLDDALQDTVPAVLALFEALPSDNPFLSLDPLQRRRRTLEALKRVLLRESQVQPLLLVFEDLHWIDSETQAVLDSLVESLPTARVLLLVNYRPEYQHGWGSKTYYTQLRLDPLPEASADTLLQALLGDDAELVPLTQLLIARTQGNPFFLEESVRTLVETGVLVGDRGAYRLEKPLDTLQVPATVQALLAARIDRLSPEDKRLLQTAAVIGTEVPGSLLHAIADTPDEALYRSLAQLQAAEFLYETSLFPERAYTFKHALTHEVAYGSLLHERRRGLHARIVEALEVLAGERLDDQVERLAHHALRGEVWQKALAYGRQAGDKAQTRAANREAVVCFEQALAALEHLPDSRAATEQAIDLRLGLRPALNALGEAPGRMLDHLRSAETLAQTLGDPLRLGQVYSYIGANFWDSGDFDRAIDYSQRALAVAATLGHVGLQARVHIVLGRVYYDAGNYARAVESLERNVATLQGELLYERFGTNGSIAVDSRAWLSYCHAELGAFTEGLAMAAEGLRIAETVNHPFTLINACYGVSVVYLRQGDVQRAIPMLERGMGLCQDWHIPLLLPRQAAALGLAYALDGHVAAGLALVEQGVEQAVAMGRPRALVLPVARLSEAYLLAGRLEDAHTRAAQAVDLARQYKQRGDQARALWLLGESTARQASPEVEPAAGHYRQALVLAEALGMRPLQAHCHLGLGTLYARHGQRQQARAALAAAIALYRAMAMTFWLPQAQEALAQVEGQ